MPRFYIDTHDRISVVDEDGYDLPDMAALRVLVQRSLIEMAAEEALAAPATHVRANVRDEAGRPIMTATVSLTVNWSGEAEAGNSTPR